MKKEAHCTEGTLCFGVAFTACVSDMSESVGGICALLLDRLG